MTVNAGVRWEPFFGQNVRSGAVSIFNLENFQKGVKSTVFLNAPAGLLYPGDPGFPDNSNAALNKQWWNLSPRVGVAWDVHGDGRLAVRTSYGLGYDFVSGQYHFLNAGAAPFANRLRVEGVPFDNPYVNTPGGNPFPIAPPSPGVALSVVRLLWGRSTLTRIPRACRTGTSPSSARSAPHGRRRRAISAAIRIGSGISWR